MHDPLFDPNPHLDNVPNDGSVPVSGGAWTRSRRGGRVRRGRVGRERVSRTRRPPHLAAITLPPPAARYSTNLNPAAALAQQSAGLCARATTNI
ncbi:hypothetical protein MRX96_025832 [Rhipicephalus microplus]